MKEYTAKLLDRVNDSMEAADISLATGQADVATGHAYDAMFHIAEALLHEIGVEFTQHSDVHTAFGQHFAQTKRLDPKYHRWLLDAFEKRTTDEHTELNLQLDAVTDMIRQAREFLDVATLYLSAEQS